VGSRELGLSDPRHSCLESLRGGLSRIRWASSFALGTVPSNRHFSSDRATLGESPRCCVASSCAAEECNGASVRSYRGWISLISWRVLHGIIESFIRVARESPSRWRVHQFMETLSPDLNAEASSSLVRLPDRLALRVEILESPQVFPERRSFSLIFENPLKFAAGHRTCCAVRSCAFRVR